jgi:hypothetical protein
MDVINEDPQTQPSQSASVPVKAQVTQDEDLDRNVQVIHQILSISNIDFKAKSIYVSKFMCLFIISNNILK